MSALESPSRGDALELVEVLKGAGVRREKQSASGAFIPRLIIHLEERGNQHASIASANYPG